MPAGKSKGAKPRTQVKDLPRKKRELTKEQRQKVKGGLLPYIEQDNLKSTNITDGTSNTIRIK